jgi:hypothetical protein
VWTGSVQDKKISGFCCFDRGKVFWSDLSQKGGFDCQQEIHGV